MAPWYGKKKAPDGTAIIEHETVERKFGFAPDIVGFAKAREAAYERLFGEMLTVSHELIPQIPQTHFGARRATDSSTRSLLAA